MDLSQTFAALGDPTRFAIIERLLQSGEMPVHELLDAGNVSPPAVSRHLKVLREAGLVRQRTLGQKRLYSVQPDALGAIGKWTMTYRAFWDGSLDRLEAALAKGADRQ